MKFKKEIAQIYLTTKWILGLYISFAPGLLSIYTITELILRLSNIVNAFVLGVITDLAIEVYTQGTEDLQKFIPIVSLALGSQLLFGIVRIFNDHSWRLIVSQDWMRLREVLYKRLNDLGVAKLEDPEVSNKAQRFMDDASSLANYLNMIVSVFGSVVTIIGSAVIIFKNLPLLLPVFFGISIVQWLVSQKYLRELWILNRDSTEERRKALTSAGSLGDSATLKELKLTGGHAYLAKKYRNFVDWISDETQNIRIRWGKAGLFNRVLDVVGFGYGLLVLLSRLAKRMITVGELTFLFRTLGIFSDSFQGIVLNLVGIREASIRYADMKMLFFEIEPDKNGEVKLQSGTPPIEIKNIDFTYPNTTKKVISDLSLTVKPGEKIAIVGENGAGKTTLVKLLSRFYRVNEGEILIDSININDLRISSLYKKLGILFQDFNHYGHMTLRENIEIGKPDKKYSEKDLEEALKRANASEFVNDFPNKYNQILSERFKGGIRPSTGQWQKIAIARFFYRDAPVLILDEPTASIDAVAEAQIFDNIYKFIKNKTVIIISHRFSTVRNADRIIVLDKGKIVEDGTHEELLKNNGKYAKAFNLQAKGYN